MTGKTRLQLASMALDEMLVVGAGQSPADEDIEKVDGRLDGLIGELEGRGVLQIADDQDIPVEWTGPLAELLANECARSFGKEKMPEQMREAVEERLRIMVNRQDTNKTLKVDPSMQSGRYGYTVARWTRGT
jgi:hypothetical protein